MFDFDAVVVGGGPAGMSAALVLGRMRHRVLLVDEGRGRNLTPDGAQRALRESAAKSLTECDRVQVEGGVVDTVSGAGGSFQVTTSEGLDAAARLVVLATGVDDDPPALPGLARLWGRCVLHCVYCDGWEVRDQPLGVLVTKADDLYAASRLRHLSADLTVFAHGVELTGRHREQLDALGIAAADGPIEELSPDGDGLVARTAGGARTALRALFVQAGVRPASGLAAQLGCRMSPSGLVLVDSFYRTSVPGIYAVGDMARPAQSRFKPMQVAVAAADGVTAGIAADQALAKGDLPFGYFADAGEQ